MFFFEVNAYYETEQIRLSTLVRNRRVSVSSMVRETISQSYVKETNGLKF